MTATEFVEKIKSFAATKADFTNVDFPEEFAEMLAKGYTYSSIGKIKNSSNEIVNLISNYDMSAIEIGMISFDKEITENEGYIFFGKLELDLLAISKTNNEIVIIDYSDKDTIMQYCAAKSSKFLDALIVAWEAMTQFLLDEEKAEDEEYREAVIANCTELAGGEHYFDFYNYLLGD
jgi:hypothetical protein